MIFFFTGTGNSLYVARELAACAGGDVRSIARELAGGLRRYEDDVIGIVSPVYYHELPEPVKAFIRGSEFACEYFFVVGTYGCRHGGFAELTRAFLDDCGCGHDYVNTIIMVDNALPGYDIAEQLRIDPEKQVDEHIAAIRADIGARRCYVQPVTQADLDHHFAYLAKGKIAPTDDEPLYSVSDACIACSVCARVCPMGCISVEGGRAHHAYGNCAICMACIHACPQFAIRFATLSEKNPGVHYRNPHVSIADLFAANSQKVG